MSKLKEKYEIPSYEEMAKVLRANGWQTWYHNDNWVNVKWYDEGKDVSMMGRSTKSAFKLVKKK